MSKTRNIEPMRPINASYLRVNTERVRESGITVGEIMILVDTLDGITSNEALALASGITKQSMKNRITGLFSKLNVFDKAQMAAKAVEMGLVEIYPTSPRKKPFS